MERSARERIRFIKQTVKKHELAVKDVVDLCDKNGSYFHPKTITKVLGEGSEDLNYQYNTIVGVYEALYNTYGDDEIPDDVAALKRIIADRNRQIDNLLMQIEKMEEHHREQEQAHLKTISLLEKDLEQINNRFDKVLAAYLADKSG